MNEKFSKLNENLEKINKKNELNKIICFRNKNKINKIRTLEKMGITVDKIIDFNFKHSSLIEEAEYDVAAKELTLIFANGKKSIYKNVPEDLINEFKNTNSTTSFYKENIKNKYDSIEI